MRKLVVFLISFIFLLLPFNVCAEEARFDTIHDMYHYFSAHKKFPEYFCGMWSTDGTMYNITVAVLDTEEGERGRQEILDWVRDDSSITFTYGKYSLNYLRSLQDTLMKEMKGKGIVCAGVAEDKNILEVGILNEYKDNPETIQLLAEVSQNYGDAVSIYYTDLIYTLEDKDIGGTVIFDSMLSEPKMNLRLYFILVVVILLSGTAVAVALLRRKRKVFLSVNGNTVDFPVNLSEKEVEQLVKSAEADVPSDLEDKIFKEIENGK